MRAEFRQHSYAVEHEANTRTLRGNPNIAQQRVRRSHADSWSVDGGYYWFIYVDWQKLRGSLLAPIVGVAGSIGIERIAAA